MLPSPTHRGTARVSGQSVAEFALILPIMLLLAVAIGDFGRVYASIIAGPCHDMDGPVAQRSEQGTFNPRVLGSNPSRLTTVLQHGERFIHRTSSCPPSAFDVAEPVVLGRATAPLPPTTMRCAGTPAKRWARSFVIVARRFHEYHRQSPMVRPCG